MKFNKKGFTLVELLAVIVVLGIIALIGFTSVGSIISDSRNKGAENNISQYIHAIEVGCSAYQALNPEATSITIDNALSKASFTGTAPTVTTGTLNLNATTCKVTPTENTKVTSNNVTCSYASSKWTCGS